MNASTRPSEHPPAHKGFNGCVRGGGGGVALEVSTYNYSIFLQCVRRGTIKWFQVLARVAILASSAVGLQRRDTSVCQRTAPVFVSCYGSHHVSFPPSRVVQCKTSTHLPRHIFVHLFSTEYKVPGIIKKYFSRVACLSESPLKLRSTKHCPPYHTIPYHTKKYHDTTSYHTILTALTADGPQRALNIDSHHSIPPTATLPSASGHSRTFPSRPGSR